MSPHGTPSMGKACEGNFSPAPITERSRICEDTWVPLGHAMRRVLAAIERERADRGSPR